MCAAYRGVVVHIDDTCQHVNSNDVTVSLDADLAIVTRGSILPRTNAGWDGVGSTRNLILMSSWPDAGSPPCPTQDIRIENAVAFNSLVETFVYTPCITQVLNNNSAFSGQVVAQTVEVGNQFNMNYKPIEVPGPRSWGSSRTSPTSARFGTPRGLTDRRAAVAFGAP